MNCDEGRDMCVFPHGAKNHRANRVNRFGGLRRFSSRKGAGSTLECCGNIQTNQTNPPGKTPSRREWKKMQHFLDHVLDCYRDMLCVKIVLPRGENGGALLLHGFLATKKGSKMATWDQSLAEKKPAALNLTKPWPFNTQQLEVTNNLSKRSIWRFSFAYRFGKVTQQVGNPLFSIGNTSCTWSIFQPARLPYQRVACQNHLTPHPSSPRKRPRYLQRVYFGEFFFVLVDSRSKNDTQEVPTWFLFTNKDVQN